MKTAFVRTLVAGLILCGALASAARAEVPANVLQAYQELFAQSQRERRGLMFIIKGQTIGGAVVRVIGNDAVEVRNQQYSRIIIRLDSIDAVSMN